MKNRLIICICSLIVLSPLFNLESQAWIQELEKHKDKSFAEIDRSMESYFDLVGRDKGSKYKHYARWARTQRDHVSSNGHVLNYANKNEQLLKRMEKQIQLQSRSGNSRHYHANWESVNPDNFQTPTNAHPSMGRINCMVKQPSNNNIIYVGAATGGVWKSFNNGITWTPLMDGMVQLGVSSIVIDYTNESHILVMTGDADFGHMPSSGVFESFDGGNSWNALYEFPLSDKNFGYKMIQSWTNSNDFYIAMKGTQPGIMRLSTLPTDTLYVEYEDAGVFDIEYKPDTPNILYASSTKGLLRKVGQGNWDLMNIDPNSSGLPTGNFSRTQVAVTTDDPNVIYNLYLRYENPKHYWALYMSDDGGAKFNLQVDSSYSTNLVGDQGYLDLVLEVDPNASEIVYLGGQSLFSSSDTGKTWVQDMQNLHADMHNMYFESDAQYICTDGGVSKKLPGSTAWEGINNGLLVTQFYNIDIDGSRFLGGTQDNGTMYWYSGFDTGLRVMGGDGFDCLLDKNDPGILYGSNIEQRKRSTDNGSSFSNVHNNRYKGPIKNWVNTQDSIISTEEFIHVSFNNGVTWQPKINPFAPDTMRIIGFSQCALSPNIVYVNSLERVYKTENFNLLSNATWIDITGDLPIDPDPDKEKLMARDIVVHPGSPNLAWITRAGYQNTQIYVTYTGGNNWFPWSAGISELPVYSMTYDSQNGGELYIGTELGVYFRKISMSEWIPFSTYLPRVPVQEVVIDNGYVYAGTFGRGLWRSPVYRDCDTNIVLTQANDPTNGNSSGLQIHKASNILISSRIVQGGAGTKVLYQAGNYVDLTSGFHGKDHIEFVAKSAGCLE